MGDGQKSISRNVGCLKKKKELSSTFKVNKVNLKGEAQLTIWTILISEHCQHFQWNQLAKKSCQIGVKWGEITRDTLPFKIFCFVPCSAMLKKKKKLNTGDRKAAILI